MKKYSLLIAFTLSIGFSTMSVAQVAGRDSPSISIVRAHPSSHYTRVEFSLARRYCLVFLFSRVRLENLR